MTAYDPALDDDEWREVNFRDDVLQSALRLGRVASATALIEYARKHGKDGILESAIMLGQWDYRKVEEALRQIPDAPKVRRRARSV